MDKHLINSYVQYLDSAWASERFYELLDESHDKAWPIVVEAIRNVKTENALGMISAGPLEDILCVDGDRFLSDIRVLISEDNFSRCLLMGVRLEDKGNDGLKELIAQLMQGNT